MTINVVRFIGSLIIVSMFAGMIRFGIGYMQKTNKYVKMKIEEA